MGRAGSSWLKCHISEWKLYHQDVETSEHFQSQHCTFLLLQLLKPLYEVIMSNNANKGALHHFPKVGTLPSWSRLSTDSGFLQEIQIYLSHGVRFHTFVRQKCLECGKQKSQIACCHQRFFLCGETMANSEEVKSTSLALKNFLCCLKFDWDPQKRESKAANSVFCHVYRVCNLERQENHTEHLACCRVHSGSCGNKLVQRSSSSLLICH